MKVLSIIIPSYNSAHFLDQCISSMIVAEVLDKLDIIVVNDGSTDNIEDTVEKYCRQYPDSIRLISQENKGHGGALNTGCAAAVGKYLKPIDADDWVETCNLQAFVCFLEGCESDVVITQYNTVDIGTQEIKQQRTEPRVFGEAVSLDEVMENWRCYYKGMTYHGITYRTDFYKTHGIALSEHVFYEDYEFATFPCCRAERLSVMDLLIYDYRIGDVNQSVSYTNRLKRIGHHEAVLKRIIAENRKAVDLDHGGRAFVAMKLQELLLSYLTTTLLVDPNRAAGRARAKEAIRLVKEGMPEAYAIAKWKCRVFWLMNYLHFTQQTCEKILRSKLYRVLRGS